MSEEARPRRAYNATKRRAAAAQTRARIIDAAAGLFVEQGYVATTVPQIATAAGVAVETVYRTATGKAGLLEAAVQSALAGGVERASLPVDERPGIQRVIQAPSPAARLVAYAATQPGVWSRVGPLLRVLDEAAPADPALRRLQDEHAAFRRAGLRRFAGLLARDGALRPELSVERAGDLIWTLAGPWNYEALVTVCGWTHRQYESWLGATLVRTLLSE